MAKRYVMVIKYVIRGYVTCGLSDLQQTSYVLLCDMCYVGTCHMVHFTSYMGTQYVPRGYPYTTPPARCVSRSVFVSEMVWLFGFENKKWVVVSFLK